MYKGFNEKVKQEIIVLSDLKNLNYQTFRCCYDTWSMAYTKLKEYPNKSKEEIISEINEEIKKETEKPTKETQDKFYLINNEKTKELEQKFKQIKLKVNFNSTPKILGNGKLYTFSQGYFTLYDNRFFNKLYEIKLEKKYITSAIQLDNKDLIFLAANSLIVYRLKEEKYVLFQKIEENQTGYHMQWSSFGCRSSPKTYDTEFIKEISGNRFICVSNYGFKMYSLNEKNEYSIALLEWYHEGLKTIHEINKNSFIFSSQIDCTASLAGPAHNILIIDKIDLREITQIEKKNKLFNEADCSRYYYGHSTIREEEKIKDENAIKLIDSLKFTYDHKKFIEYSTYGEYHYFKGNTILKNKYFIIGIDNYILIFDIFSGMELKRYQLFINGGYILFICNANIKKWNNNEDNKFLINIKGNIILFELTNDNDLKIISQSYFENINCLKILNEKNNGFYNDGKDEDVIYDFNYYFYSKNNHINENCSLSIFY